jgi:asparagine synthase (glutamine-hydrolysing)
MEAIPTNLSHAGSTKAAARRPAKVDITSMAHGLECRCPFLDERLVEFAVSIPFRLLVEGGRPKPLVTSTFREYFPPALRERPKAGFEVPLDDWFRGPLRELSEDYLLSDASLARGYFYREGLEAVLDEHRSMRWNHGNRLWSLICLEAWHRTYIDPPEVPTAPLGNLIDAPANAHRPVGSV